MEQKPSEQKPSRALTIGFLAFLLLFGGLFCLLPDREFSDAENRYLAQFPDFSLAALFRDNWTGEFETYAADQFPGRDAWVGAKAGSQYLLGFRENNGVYFGKDGLLIQDYQSGSRLAANASLVARFSENLPVPVRFGLIPNSVAVNVESLPPFPLAADQRADIAAAYALCPGIDILSAMEAREGLYYRTDHHWTAEGAYAAYTAIAPALGFDALPREAFEQTLLSEEFHGTLSAKSGAWWVEPDAITGWIPKNTPEAMVEIHENGALEMTLNGYFSFPRLETRDRYAVFLDGNHALTVIKTGLANGRRLLLIKDSFSHALAPLLSAHYEEIHLIDLRYYRPDFTAYVGEHGVTEALILYSVSNFAEDGNLIFLNAQ